MNFPIQPTSELPFNVAHKYLAPLFEATITQSYDAVVITDALPSPHGQVIVFANPAFCKLTGYTIDELIGRSPRILQGKDTDQKVLNKMRISLREGRFFEGSTINYRKDGSAYDVEWNISPIRDVAGVVRYFVSVQRDISVRAAEQKMRDLITASLNAAFDAILVTDYVGKIIAVNHAYEKLTGYLAHELLGKTPALLKSGAHDTVFYQEMWQKLNAGLSFSHTFINRRKNGSLFHAEQSIAPIRDEKGKITHFVSVSKDQTDRVKATLLLEDQASKDPLTGMFNRRAGELLLKHNTLIEHAFCVIIADIDHFKKINDVYGHGVGDRVLVNVTGILRDQVRMTDSVVRWGGEEFLIVAPDCELQAAMELAERIRLCVERHVDKEVGSFTISLGVAQSNLNESLSSLVDRADKALYQAKDDGRNCVRQAS
jgi:diguanylate cyclase (GGDEF)-like protein/PAS domain S-box-containing protein